VSPPFSEALSGDFMGTCLSSCC